jgi:crossover junction endodeoxyribonuclease RusA
MTVLIITAPMPPSVNGMYANVPGKGRVKTAAYKSWITEAGWAVKPQIKHRFSGDVRVSVAIGPRRNRDIDNTLKPILDLLQSHYVVANDRQVIDLSVKWSDDVEGCRIEIADAREP